MNKNQIEKITKINFEHYIDKKKITDYGFKKLNKNTYYKEIKVEKNCRYILCFGLQLYKDQTKSRNKATEEFKEFVIKLNKELLLAKKSREKKSTYSKFEKQLKRYKLKSFIDIKLKKITIGKIYTYQGEILIDQKKKNYASRLDGFWLLVTDHIEKNKNKFKKSTEELIAPYKEKVIIESSFRDIKSFIEISPVNVWTEDHVKAHYTICVLSYLINRTLTFRLHKNIGTELSSHIVTHCSLYKALEDCLIDHIYVKNVDLYTYNISNISDMQLELLKRIDLEYLADKTFLKKLLKK